MVKVPLDQGSFGQGSFGPRFLLPRFLWTKVPLDRGSFSQGSFRSRFLCQGSFGPGSFGQGSSRITPESNQQNYRSYVVVYSTMTSQSSNLSNIIEKLENSTLKVIKSILIKMQFFLTNFFTTQCFKSL